MKDFEALEREIRAAAQRSVWAPNCGEGGVTTWTGEARFGQAGHAINEALTLAGFEPEKLPQGQTGG